jgi:hypothetical protein
MEYLIGNPGTGKNHEEVRVSVDGEEHAGKFIDISKDSRKADKIGTILSFILNEFSFDDMIAIIPSLEKIADKKINI